MVYESLFYRHVGADSQSWLRLRHLVAKVASKLFMADMAELLASQQLGYGVRGGSEAAILAAHCFLGSRKPDQAIWFCQCLQLHQKGLHARGCTITVFRNLYSFVHSAHASLSNLLWDDWSISSALWVLYFSAWCCMDTACVWSQISRLSIKMMLPWVGIART